MFWEHIFAHYKVLEIQKKYILNADIYYPYFGYTYIPRDGTSIYDSNFYTYTYSCTTTE